VFAGATPFLRLMATVVGGGYMAQSALAATRLLAAGDADTDFLRAKIATARFFVLQLLPQVHGLAPQVTGTARELFAMTEDQYALR
jgi:hypothetical protein